MIPKFSSKALATLALAVPLLVPTKSEAVFVIAGVSDGTLSGGNPKAIFLQAAVDIPDLSIWGVGSANNGGGTDGVEFTFPAGSANAGDLFIIAGNPDSFNFFNDNFSNPFTLFNDGTANINGDDAIEVFQSGSVFDTYGDINVDGNGETWEYANGFALRTGGSFGAFDQANYSSNTGAFNGLDEQGHIDLFVNVAGFTPVPEPSALALFGIAGLALLRRRR